MKRTKIPPVNTGSMADVAFLLLIFFLVTTTIQTEAGLPTTLPPWSEDYQPVSSKNVFNIQLNATGALLIEEKVARLEELSRYIDQFLEKTSASNMVVHLEHDQQVDYNKYLTVYNAIKAVYKKRWQAIAIARYGRSYKDLASNVQRGIQKEWPLVFAETQWDRSIGQ
ncbi:MAG: ExbD/TolR family protein [Aureispira sp.]